MMSRSWTTSPTAGITTSPRNVCPNAGVATLPDSVIGRLSLQLSGSGQLQLKGLEHIQTSIWYDKNIDRTNPVQEWPANLDPCWFFVPSSCLCWPFVFHGRPKRRAQTWKRKPWKRSMCRGSLGCSQWSSKLLPWGSEWIDSKIQDIQVSCDTVDLQLPICIKELTQCSEFSSLWSHCRHETDVRSCSMCFYAWFAVCQGKQLGEFVEPNS